MIATDAVAYVRRQVWFGPLQHSRDCLVSFPRGYQRGSPNRLDGKHAWKRVNKSQFFEEHKPLPQSKQVRPRAGWHKDGGGRSPAKLLADLKGGGLIAIALIGLHIVHERPAHFILDA